MILAISFVTIGVAVHRNALNLGIKDQITALEWVQRNIVHFGGDSEKAWNLYAERIIGTKNQQVTVFGESAGSIMTAVLFLGNDINRYARAAVSRLPLVTLILGQSC